MHKVQVSVSLSLSLSFSRKFKFTFIKVSESSFALSWKLKSLFFFGFLFVSSPLLRCCNYTTYYSAMSGDSRQVSIMIFFLPFLTVCLRLFVWLRGASLVTRELMKMSLNASLSFATAACCCFFRLAKFPRHCTLNQQMILHNYLPATALLPEILKNLFFVLINNLQLNCNLTYC